MNMLLICARIGLLGLVLLGAEARIAGAQETPAQSVIVVQGAAGTPEYGAEFTKAADQWASAAARGNAQFTLIGRDDTAAPGALKDKQRVKQALEEAAKDPARPLWIVLIGHGTFDGREAKFNLRDEDFSDQELAAWLKPMTRPIAVIDCSSAGAPFLTRLSAPNRVVITATRSGNEINYARFGIYMSAAIADPEADLDKDGQVSLLEAFLAAAHRVNDFYKREGRLATEHALLDDNGDKMGISPDWFQGIRPTRAAQKGAPLDGARAHQWSLIQSPAEQAMPPALRASRNALELKIEALRTRKAALGEDKYYAQLDPLLLALAHIYQQEPSPPPASPPPQAENSPAK